MSTAESTETAPRLNRCADAQCLLSICIPVYNAEATVARTLHSLLAICEADRREVEVVVVNDGSTDASRRRIEACRDALTGFRLSLLDQANGGVSRARNAALAVARGKWIFMLDADDQMIADPLGTLRSHGPCSLIGFPILRVSEAVAGSKRWPAVGLSAANYLDRLTAESPYFPSGMILRREALDFGFDPAMRYLEDWQFWFDNPRLFARMHVCREPLTRVYVHRDNRTSHFAATGVYRERLAQRLLAERSQTLSSGQRNNLHIQGAIGRILQGKPAGWAAFARVPCSARLYAKLLVYRTVGRRIGWIHPYGRRLGRSNRSSDLCGIGSLALAVIQEAGRSVA